MFLFQQPTVLETEVFSAMPLQLRRDRRSAWADANKAGACIDCFLEGPVFDTDGNLYVTDIPHGRVFRISPDGVWNTVAEYDGEPNGLKFHPDGDLVIADYLNGLMRLDPVSGKVTPWLTRRNAERFRGVNDLVFATNGDMYFTDQGQTGLHDPTGRVYRLCADGRLDLLLDNVPSPNGVALSPNEHVLYVAATRGNCVWRAPLMDDGSVSKVGQFFTFYGASGPDGLATDHDGNLVVAHASLGAAFVLNQRGEPLYVLKSVAGHTVTNIAFQGVDKRTLYLTEAETGTILRAALPASGS
ncbi:SMP-30/gluconolactonase/LRE family protein [Pseudogulbenkiania sp. MAI-1]|uniref:SMP-30/gluconolactonase/LRE family protein n=1 Tax=Pseudogulbenkiania sp. MAI-1 TaxID=990370 RepID=UPI0004A439A0|nr:SMP-30/gluconolactonase/LRE family protein [Pseudogulbenkiania sp. MAI-1]